MDVEQRLARAKAQHRNRPLYRSHLRNQQSNADSAPRELQERWFKGMYSALNEIDWATNGEAIRISGAFRFLDVGCCPGGFSSYILEKNPDARGVGISLPVQAAGHDYLLQEELRPRHELIWADILKYSFGVPGNTPGIPLPWGLRCRQFNLVLLDGHPLRPQTQTETAVGVRLLASQLIIALQSVCFGGTVIVKLACTAARDTKRIVFALDALCENLVLCKPTTIHATRDTFYAIAQGFRRAGRATPTGRDLRAAELLDGLMWRYAEYSSAPQAVNKEWLWEAVCSRADIQAHAQRYKELTVDVDRVQCEAIEGAMKEELRTEF